MNLRSIYLTCANNIETLQDLKAAAITINGRVGKRVEGWGACLKAIEELKKVDALEQECDDLIDAVPSFFIAQDTFDILETEWKKISDKKSCLYRTIIDIMDLCEKMGFDEENENFGIDIKLPVYHDFSEFVEYVNDLHFILTKCPFVQNEKEKIEFRNVDVGSTWLSFVIEGALIVGGASVLLNNIAALVDKCIIIRSHYLTTEKEKQDIEREKRNTAEKEVIIKYLTETHKKQVDVVIQELEATTGYKVENKDGDERLRIEQCMERLGILLEKGLQIYAAIDTPDEAKALFQPLEMKYLEYQKKMELLEVKEEHSEEE